MAAAARAQRPAMPVVGFVHSVVANPGPSVGGYSTEGSGRSLHAILIGSSVDMAPGLRELIALSLLASLGCALHWPTVTCFSSLFLAAPSQWRLSRRYDVYGEVIERLVRLLAD
jgi:hypothetical protein